MIEAEEDKALNSLLLFKFPKLIEWPSNGVVSKENKHASNDKQILEWSFMALYNEMRFYKYLPGKIIFLLGTSSAGKSSIVKYIKENSIMDANLLVSTGTDLVICNLIIGSFLEKSPRNMKFLLNQIGTYNRIKIKEYIEEPEKFTLDLDSLNLSLKNSTRVKTILVKFHNMRREVLSDAWTQYPLYCARAIISSLEQRKTIIIDTIELHSFFQPLSFYLIKCNIDTVVIYCPPKKLEEHIIQRNKIGIQHFHFSELRFFFPFKQYSDIYMITSNKEQAIDKITLLDIQSIDANAKVGFLKSYILELQIENKHTLRNKIWQNLLLEIDSIISEPRTSRDLLKKQSLIDEWLLPKENAVYIKPKCLYQMFLNSGILDTVDCGKRILTIIDKPLNFGIRSRFSLF
jgi:hypothetical protein